MIMKFLEGVISFELTATEVPSDKLDKGKCIFVIKALLLKNSSFACLKEEFQKGCEDLFQNFRAKPTKFISVAWGYAFH